mmetsp:Transcript_65559/g.168746  ORF Transcript_65559/g.168746 Transcript_65559/m.168746 type:complete len:267 (+) Transcript_65559:335-1135(+)
MAQRGGFILSTKLSKAALNSSCAGFMSDVWKAPPVLMTRACKAFAAVARLHSSSTAALVPPQVKPPAKRKLATLTNAFGDGSAFVASSHSWSTLARSRPATEAMACGVISVARCIASARSLTSVRPSSKSSTPAATRAVYSPSERPATHCGRSTTSGLVSLSRSMAAKPAMNMMGWQYLVSWSFSSGPLRARSCGSQPRISLAFRRYSFTVGLSMTLLSMPTYCEPCPGKRRAALTGITTLSKGATLELGRSSGFGSAPSSGSGSW